MFLDKLLQYALFATFLLLSIFVHDSSSIIKRKFGIEYSNGGIFPDAANRYDVPDIPDTWRNLDSFKFDRSIEKAENYESGKVFKHFDGRSTEDRRGKFRNLFYFDQTKIFLSVQHEYKSIFSYLKRIKTMSTAFV